ncbi:MAG: SCO family protein, partial [Myxococcales bacterium]|nr:SCO family protein [Myxococcales bacterium]
FEPPEPGSYELPPIGQVRDHTLLDHRGRATPFPALAPGRVAVVSFVYGSCPHACPLALSTLQQLDRMLAERPQLGPRVRLVTVSFDPGRDTPARMSTLRDGLDPRSEWRFVTAPDAAALEPVLVDYGQRVTRLVDPEGSDTGILRHVLKVFLVDEHREIRNVYSAGLMDARLVLNDIQTVLSD